jgi:hypothetical protein
MFVGMRPGARLTATTSFYGMPSPSATVRTNSTMA